MYRWKGHFKELLSAGKAAVLENGGNKLIKTKEVEKIEEQELMEALSKIKLGKPSQKTKLPCKL